MGQREGQIKDLPVEQKTICFCCIRKHMFLETDVFVNSYYESTVLARMKASVPKHLFLLCEEAYVSERKHLFV